MSASSEKARAIEAREARLRDLAPEIYACMQACLNGQYGTWMAARAEVEGEYTSRRLFELEPEVIKARAVIAKIETP